MKTFKKMTVFLLALCMAGTLPVTVLAAAKEEYTYTVRIFAGAKGTFSGKEMVTFSNLKAGERVTFNLSDVALEEGSKYYIKGIRESGKDNNTVSSQSSFEVTGDQDYVVAYGIKGNVVGYTIRYVDQNGSQLLPDETYYGNVGDRPVIAYQYIENYIPQAYNLTGTLKENEAENVFVFTYTATGGAEETSVVPGNPESPGNPEAPEAPEEGDAETTEDAEGEAAEGTPDAVAATDEDAPDDLLDIEDGEIPLADLGEDQLTNVSDGEVPLGRGDFARRLLDFPIGVKAGIISLAVLVGFGLRYLYIRKKRKRKEQNAE